jgi:hypothetical protein
MKAASIYVQKQELASIFAETEAGTDILIARHNKPAEYHSCASALEQDIQQFLLRDLTLDLCDSRTLPVVSTPRSLELAHLRTALWFHDQERLIRFVSLDDEQMRCARELGLPV